MVISVKVTEFEYTYFRFSENNHVKQIWNPSPDQILSQACVLFCILSSCFTLIPNWHVLAVIQISSCFFIVISNWHVLAVIQISSFILWQSFRWTFNCQPESPNCKIESFRFKSQLAVCSFLGLKPCPLCPPKRSWKVCCSVISRCSRHHLHMFQFEFVIKWGGKASGNTHRKTKPKKSRKVTKSHEKVTKSHEKSHFKNVPLQAKRKWRQNIVEAHEGQPTKSHKKSRKSLKVTETFLEKCLPFEKTITNKERNCIRFRSEGLCSR